MLVLSACGSSGPDATTSGSDATSTVDQIERVLFGYGDTPSDTDLRAEQDKMASHEERVAQCMAKAGFDYVAQSADVTSYVADEFDFLSRDYAATYGFGYTTRLDDPIFTASDVSEDPNSTYVESLTSGEQEQYYVALYGDQSYWDEIESEEDRIALEAEQPELFEPSGCQAEATSPESRASQAFWTKHGDEMNELFEQAESSTSVQAPLQEWQVCMAEHGHNFSTPDDFDSVMDPYLNDLYATAVHPGDGLSDEQMTAMTDEELNELWSQPATYDTDLLAEAQEYEIELALTSWDCGLPGLYDAYRQELQNLQERFVENNLDELRTLVAG